MGKLKCSIEKGNVILDVWLNEAKKGEETFVLPNFIVKRFYLDKETKKRKLTDSFREKDLPEIIEAIMEYQANATAESSDTP